MNLETQNHPQKRQGGQTIIVAMIMLGLLLILGFVFIGIINRNVKTSGRMQDRTVADDLSEAGIRYAHAQLLHSQLGADWRGTPTPPVTGSAVGLSIDPDAYYLRPAGFLQNGNRVRFAPGNSTPFDMGGPDGLGPYFRVNFANGRALVRVRYAQSDAAMFQADPSGPLRSPGLARSYIIIESVGREGVINTNDPTTLKTDVEHRIQNFASQAEFQQEMATLRATESRFAGIHINRAFASIGITEHARFITNLFQTSRPAEMGIPADLGSSYRDGNTRNLVSASLTQRIGGAIPLVTLGNGTTASIEAGSFPGGGSTYVNADLKLYGKTEFDLIQPLGEGVSVAGSISTDDPAAELNLVLTRYAGNTPVVDSNPGVPGNQPRLSLSGGQFSSSSNLFQTLSVLRDGILGLDSDNRPRGIGRKSPPLITEKDPQTGVTRYVALTRDSGSLVGNGNSARFGHGSGVYVDNGSRRQMPVTNSARINSGGASALMNEWLSPGGDPLQTGWRGWLYAPPGAIMELLPDGFTIQRDGSGAESQWRTATGALTGSSLMRYRLGRASDGSLRIVDTLTFADPDRINGNLAAADFDSGFPFNGVVYFEGNVRVRGIIPTDVQISLVSNATIYIEGSITKGVLGNQFTATYPSGATAIGSRLQRSSRSMLMLMAKDYVTLNTTQFFGANRLQAVVPKEDTPTVGSLNPIVMAASDPNGLRMLVDYVLDSDDPTLSVTQRSNPSNWRPYTLGYENGAPVISKLLVSHTMDNGAAPASFLSLNINPTAANSSYLFPASSDGAITFSNLASDYFAGTFLPYYGLGAEPFERYTQFESVAFPLVNPAQVTTNVATDSFTSTALFGRYQLRDVGLNEFQLRPVSLGSQGINDYLLGRFAVTPHDVKIEASIYAQEGSFFVIPGAWFNPNPNDTFATWSQGDTALPNPNLSNSDDVNYLNQRRVEQFGSYPDIPFYGEPLDVQIQIVGSVSENMPVPMSVQAEWLRKWGWIPEFHGSSGEGIPSSHRRGTASTAGDDIFPNLTVTYDPVLATGRQNGYVSTANEASSPVLRTDEYGRPLPPLPRLPVSPTLAYFGEVR